MGGDGRCAVTRRSGAEGISSSSPASADGSQSLPETWQHLQI